MEQLVGVRQIAERLNVKRQAVHNWRERDLGFPEPLDAQLDQLIWSWPDVEQWGKDTGRLDAEGQPVRRED